MPHAALEAWPWSNMGSFNGYLREDALRSLSGGAPNGFVFMEALRRLNDWVPQVRSAARNAIPRLARRTDPTHVADALCGLMSMWTSWGRWTDAEKQVALDLMALEGVPHQLAQRVMDSPSGPMPTVLTQLMRSSVLDAHLATIAARAVQPAVRACATRILLMGRAIWTEAYQWRWTDRRYAKRRRESVVGGRDLAEAVAFEPLLQAAAVDRSSLVRRVAAEMAIRHPLSLGDALEPLAQQLAADPCRAVAERGRFLQQRLDTPSR